MMTIACILNGDKYTPRWVDALKYMVDANMTVEHRFVCLTTRGGMQCDIIPDRSGWTTWWAKLNFFNPNHPSRQNGGPLVYMDIDTVIAGSLDFFAEFKGEFGVIADVYRPKGFGGGVFMLGEGFGREVFDTFNEHPWEYINSMASDMQFYEKFRHRAELLTDLFPGRIVSYKVHCRDGLPENASIVRFHGSPKVTDLPTNHPLRVTWEQCRSIST